VVTASDATHAAPAVSVAGRWPLPPLLHACGLSRRALARQLAIGPAAVSAAGRRGLSDAQADEWAIRLGLHPLLVWGWAWIDEAPATGPAHARFAQLLRDQIERGDLRPGDKLPPVHVLARRWGVGSKTAAKAIAELRAEGLVVGGGRGWPHLVASPLAAGTAACVVCGRPIELGEEHYPHRPHCALAARGWCDCDATAHPECCPTCAQGRAS
jgi:hypothetical protein